MKSIGIGIAALGLSLSALTFGAKAANAAEPCAPQVVTVQPSGYFYGPRDFRARERLRIERQRELARQQWLSHHRGFSYRYGYGR